MHDFYHYAPAISIIVVLIASFLSSLFAVLEPRLPPA